MPKQKIHVEPYYSEKQNKSQMSQDDGMKLKQNICELCNSFTKETSLHGVSHIAGSTHYSLRLFWLVISMVSFGLLGYQMHHLSQSFYQYNTVTDVKLIVSIIIYIYNLVN